METLTEMPIAAENTPAVEAAADERGAPEDIEGMLRDIIALAAKLAYESALAQKTEADAAQPGEDRTRFIEELLRQEDEIRQERPEFDLTATIGESAAFRALILAGEPVRKALDYIEPERSMERMEMDMLGRIRKRNLRPAPMSAGNHPPVENAQERFDDEEMRRIDQQLKRGQKVYV